MMKTGNNNSKLLDKFAAIAAQKPKQVEVDFDINAILKNQPKAPSLKEILADVMKNGKNITRTAQFNDQPAIPGGEPDELGGMVDDILDEGSMPDDGGMEGGGCDNEAVKSNLVEALVALCGSPEAACDCIMGQNGPEEGLPEEGMEGPPMSEEMPGLDETALEPEPMSSPMPKQMPGIV